MSFCLITGRARSLPKPNFFPIIPPISPADARRLCRITGKRMDTHNYLPLLELGKRPDCVKCTITGKKAGESMPSSDSKKSHAVRNDFKYVTPILRKDAMEQGDAKAFEDLQKVLKRLKKGLPEGERDRMFVYMMPSLLCGLIIPAEVEEAIKIGEMEMVSLSKTCDKAIFKVRGKPTLFIPLKEVDIKVTANNELLLDGLGQSKETLAKQRKVLEEKKRRTLANKKIFEDLERQADEELQKDLDRPKGQSRIFGGKKSKEAKEFRQKLTDFRDVYLPASNMSNYGADWVKLVQTANVDSFDWANIDKVRQIDLDTPLPKRSTLISSEQPILDDNKIAEVKRKRKVYISDGPGLEIVPYLEAEMSHDQDLKIPGGLEDYITQTFDGQEDGDFNGCWSLKSMFSASNEDAIKILPTLDEFLSAMTADPEKELFVRTGCIYDTGDGPKFCENPASAPKDSNVIVGAIFKILPKAGSKEKGELMRFFPGHFLPNGTFVPGQRMASAKGEFIPAACIRATNGGFKHCPGIMASNKLVAGQFIRDGNDFEFLKGQVIHTKFGSKYVEGETVHTADGLKFVAGIQLKDKFVSGAVVDEGGENSRFVQGQMISDENGENVVFIPGEMGLIDAKEMFVPGQRVDGRFFPGQMIDGGIFVHGEIITSIKGLPQFLPGMYSEDGQFVPGMICDTLKKETVFVEGKLFSGKGSETLFVPGHTTIINDGQDNRFEKCKNAGEIRSARSPSPPPIAIDCEGLSLIYKRIKPKNGTMLMWKDGSQFFPEGVDIPQDLLDSATGAELITGRMECTENGPQFVAGKVMEIHGIRTFIPGKTIKDEQTGELVFVPGKMIMDGKNGPRFLPGQVIESEDGDERFIPGQIMDSPDGVTRFVPGQIIETKTGPVFIPGQVLRTDNGLKFVPGVIVETANGSAIFVPSQVLDSPEGARLLKGHIVDTPEGPRLLPPDIKGDGVDLDYVVQGFDIDPVEARLILGGKNDNSDFSDILDGIGGSSIGAEALRALAEGFESRRGNVIKNVGEGEDVDKLLQDEMLDSCDSPAIRKIIRSSFLAVFADLCKRIDEIISQMNTYINDCLLHRLDGSLMLADMKLNPALESLKRYFESKSPNDPAEYDILNLVAGIITCSIPGALKECCSDNAMGFEEAKFKSTLLSCIEDSIKGILEEDGTLSNGLMEDIKELVMLAKDLEFDENDSFFAKVAAVTEGRCNSKFMDTLLKNLRTSSSENHISTSELLTRLINILAPRLHLQSGFKELSSNNPEFVQEVLDCLKGDPREIEGFTAIDILHHAITKTINNRCQRQIDDVVHKVELDGLVLEKDQDIRSMLEQAIGLAKYMNKSSVVDSLFELLGDPIRLEAIRDDPVIKDVLNKILVMQKLTAKDKRKRQKLEKLQRYHHQFSEDSQDEDDKSLKELIKICEALTRPPNHGNLKKSKSMMVKKSKSMIMTARDIPMNAFMAMKSTAHEKDEKWLQNFLSESLVEDIPWECSKALIILKEGFQAIIPREASRSILMGEASYTLIDENGVEFYLSPKDKLNRSKQGFADDHIKKVSYVDDDTYEPNGTIPEEEDEFDQTNGDRMLEDIREENSSTPFNENLDQYRPGHFAKSRPLLNPDLDDLDDDLDEGTMASLQKYRPSAYEVGPPRGSDDINDIRDYYSNLGTRTRAIRRFAPTSSHDDFDLEPSYGGMQRSFPSRNYGNGYDDEEEELNPLPPVMPAARPPPVEYDDSTRYLLEKAKAARSRPVWEPEPVEKFDRQYFDRPSPPKLISGVRNPEDSMMSSKTRSLLDKLKESTATLQDMSLLEDHGDDQPVRGGRRKQSRFLRRAEEPPARSDFDAHRMADEILGESLFPPREDARPTRKYSYQSSLDTDRFSDRSSPEVRPRRRFDNDDDDIDAMINSLKQKTSGRDMHKVIHDIEGSENSGEKRMYGRRSVSPVQRRNLYADLQPPPTEMSNVRSSFRNSQQHATNDRSKYDPYDHLRGGTGYNFDFERPVHQDAGPPSTPRGYHQAPTQQSFYGYQQQQQQQPPMASYDPYGYNQPAPSMRPGMMGYPMQQPMYQGYGATGGRPSGRRPQMPSYGYYE